RGHKADLGEIIDILLALDDIDRCSMRNLQIGRVVRLAINVLGDRRRERLAAAVYLLRLLRLEFRQPKLASHIITARDRIVARELCTTNPSRAVLSSLTASERSAAPCPGPGASTSPLTTSPPRALASSCAEIIACVWFGVASKLSRSGLAISWGSRAVWAAAGLRAFGGIPPVAPSIAAASSPPAAAR